MLDSTSLIQSETLRFREPQNRNDTMTMCEINTISSSCDMSLCNTTYRLFEKELFTSSMKNRIFYSSVLVNISLTFRSRDFNEDR